MGGLCTAPRLGPPAPPTGNGAEERQLGGGERHQPWPGPPEVGDRVHCAEGLWGRLWLGRGLLAALAGGTVGSGRHFLPLLTLSFLFLLSLACSAPRPPQARHPLNPNQLLGSPTDPPHHNSPPPLPYLCLTHPLTPQSHPPFSQPVPPTPTPFPQPLLSSPRPRGLPLTPPPLPRPGAELEQPPWLPPVKSSPSWPTPGTAVPWCGPIPLWVGWTLPQAPRPWGIPRLWVGPGAGRPWGTPRPPRSATTSCPMKTPMPGLWGATSAAPTPPGRGQAPQQKSSRGTRAHRATAWGGRTGAG